MQPSASRDLREKYDWVVFGTHLGGLLSAWLAAASGLDVLLLSFHDPNPADLKMDRDTFPWRNTERDAASLLHRMVATLSGESYLEFEADRRFEWISPEARVRWGAPAEQTKGDLLRDRGAPARDYFGNSRDLARSLEYYFEDLREKTLLGDKLQTPVEWILDQSKAANRSKIAWLPPGVGWVLSDGAQLEATEWAFDAAFRKLSTLARFPRGMAGLHEWVLARLAESKVHWSPRNTCTRVFVDRGKLIGAQVGAQGKMISVGGGVAACAAEQLRELLEEVSAQSRFAETWRIAPPRGWRFNVELRLQSDWRGGGVPRAGAHTEADGIPLEWELREGPSVVLRTVFPWSPETLSQGYADALLERMTREFERLAPGHRCGKVVYRPRFAMLQDVPDHLRVYGRDHAQGVDTPFSGLYLVNNESFPMLGHDGLAGAALLAMAKHLGKGWQLRQAPDKNL